ncbi:DUF551 domain-containing protein [Salmonella enterica subsp. enterica serovar Newport]
MDGTVDLGGKSTYRIIKGEKAMKRLPLGTKFYIAPPAPVVDADPVVFTDERNLHHIARGRETSLIWGKQNQEVGDIPLYRHAQPVPVDKEFIPKNLDKALGVVGVALPESKEEFNFQIERWIQRLIDRVIRYADEFKEQPAPVVPEEITDESTEQRLMGRRWAHSFCAGWNACREAMLQGDEPVSQTYNLPELIEGMEVSIDVSTCDADAGNRYFGTVTEVSELDTAKNGYILLVQDAEPNFDVNGNSPVQSPIDHGYRPECECSGCKATARICAELNNEEAEIFADGYNAAMQSFGNSEQLNSPVTPDGWISCSERMPAQDDWVLLYSKYGEYLAGQVQGEYMELNDGTLSWLGSALHWMLLPEPPQEVK